uniref:Uncharacterized protein n=1 Tax=Poecilia reticulata TaxID=8081 RepID=A0A3P9PNZ6_POERE
ITHPRILIFASIFLSARPLSGKKDESMKLPTCLMCVCLKTAYIHAHFNKISKISKQDFTDMGNIELITRYNCSKDFEGNELTAVSKLTCIRERHRVNPFSTCVFVFFHFFLQNNISTIADEMFCKGDTSHYLRSNLDCVRLNGNPIKLSGYPNGFIRLQSLSVSWHN